jgi:hypothetical protein
VRCRRPWAAESVATASDSECQCVAAGPGQPDMTTARRKLTCSASRNAALARRYTGSFKLSISPLSGPWPGRPRPCRRCRRTPPAGPYQSEDAAVHITQPKLRGL